MASKNRFFFLNAIFWRQREKYIKGCGVGTKKVTVKTERRGRVNLGEEVVMYLSGRCKDGCALMLYQGII